MRFLVYALVDPRNEEIRYIGKSSSGLRRAKHHLMPSAYINGRSPVYSWIRELIELNLIPRIEVIEDCISNDQCLAVEMYYIAEERLDGIRLLNVTFGGEGSIGRKVSDKVKQRLSKLYSGRKLPKEQIEKIKRTKKENPTRYTDKMKRNASLISKRNKNVICIETGEIFHSTREAGRVIKKDHKGISDCCRGIRTTCGGFTWRFV